MRNIVVFSAKPYCAKVTAPYLAKMYPGCSITVLLENLLGYVKPKLPRGLQAKNFPVVLDIELETRVHGPERVMAMKLNLDGSLDEVYGDIDLYEIIGKADEILYSADTDHTGCLNFHYLIEHFGKGKISAMECKSVSIVAFDEATLNRSFSKVEKFGNVFGKTVDYGITKSYFDTNYATNAFYAFGPALKKSNVDYQNFPLSKYSLQLVLFLADNPSQIFTHGNLHRLLGNWPGTGKYPISHNFGSVTSRAQILENLLNAGLLKTISKNDEKKLVTVSDLGFKVVEQIHKDCHDADLAHRIEQWCNDGFEKSKPKIDKYIKTFFGKQIRFNSNFE